MSVYDNVPLIELERELLNYAPCWGTVVLVGIAIEEGNKFIPSGLQIWSRDETDEEAEIYGPPTLPADIRMYKIAQKPKAAIGVIKQIFGQESIHLGEMQIDFQQCTFGRAAFLGSHDYDYLYAKELNQRFKKWPKLFIEGGFQNRETLEKHIRSIEEELKKVNYKYHTLRDASNHLLEFPFSSAYYMGGISAVLRIPVRLSSRIEGQELGYVFELPKALADLPKSLHYVARSEKGDRDEPLAVPSGKEQENRLMYTSSVPLKPGDQVLEVVLILNGRRMDSSRIPQERALPARIEQEKVSELVTPREGKIFIVHGRNHTIRDKIMAYLTEELGVSRDMIEVLELEPFIGRTLTEKFEDVAARCRFALIILSGDDVLWQLPRPKRTKRARQNVILELGFFWGRLGRKNLAFLSDPSIELPSDIVGVGYIPLTKDLAKTKLDLLKELRVAGLVKLTA
jgi:predicted nucleotide-binding protein